MWRELYSNEKMLKSSMGSKFTWADILDRVVDVLPPRDLTDDVIGRTSNAESKKSLNHKQIKHGNGVNKTR